MSNTRIICLTPDRNFFPVAVLTAQRLLMQGLPADIDIAIVCHQEDIDRAALAGADPRLQILPHPFELSGELSLSHLPVREGITAATWRRLLLPHILPDAIERIVYIDCDTLAIRPDMACLFDLDLGQSPFAAALDMIRLKDFENGPQTQGFRAYRTALGLDCDAPYFNSGVLLIDRRRWLDAGLSEHAIDFARLHPDLCLFQEQSALNAVAKGAWAVLSPRFNFMGDFLLLDLMKEIDPVLLHFVNSPKPWQDEDWTGPEWIRALYETPLNRALPPDTIAPLSVEMRSFRRQLLTFLATQTFADGPLVGLTAPTEPARASLRH